MSEHDDLRSYRPSIWARTSCYLGGSPCSASMWSHLPSPKSVLTISRLEALTPGGRASPLRTARPTGVLRSHTGLANAWTSPRSALQRATGRSRHRRNCGGAAVAMASTCGWRQWPSAPRLHAADTQLEVFAQRATSPPADASEGPASTAGSRRIAGAAFYTTSRIMLTCAISPRSVLGEPVRILLQRPCGHCVGKARCWRENDAARPLSRSSCRLCPPAHRALKLVFADREALQRDNSAAFSSLCQRAGSSSTAACKMPPAPATRGVNVSAAP